MRMAGRGIATHKEAHSQGLYQALFINNLHYMNCLLCTSAKIVQIDLPDKVDC